MKTSSQSQANPKQLILDCKYWRSGGARGRYRTGEGMVLMRNDLGYMCCLGQFSITNFKSRNESLESARWKVPEYSYPAGIQKYELKELSEPYNPLFVRTREVPKGFEGASKFDDSYFATKLALINDEGSTTPREKINLIRKELQEKGIKLVVRNIHLLPIYPQDKESKK